MDLYKFSLNSSLFILSYFLASCSGGSGTSSSSSNSAIYSVSGSITGLNGTVVISDNNTDTLSKSTNGTFTFAEPVTNAATYNVTIVTQPTEQTCTVNNGSGAISSANITNLSIICTTNFTTISVSSTGVIPVNSGSSTITVTNTGSTYKAYNVSASLPSGWSGVTQNSSNCASITPNGGTCTLTFSSTTPYIAQRGISLTGDNITSPPTTALAFSINSYLVWSIPSGSSALVLATSDSSINIPWATSTTNINGITEISTTPCYGAIDGACDTAQIVTSLGTSYSNYAAGPCYAITSDNTGTVSLGTWFLPSICQMGGSGQGAGCSTGVANIDANLFQLGFGGLLASDYWSASEASSNPTNYSWVEAFNAVASSIQAVIYKGLDFRTRCVRALTY